MSITVTVKSPERQRVFNDLQPGDIFQFMEEGEAVGSFWLKLGSGRIADIEAGHEFSRPGAEAPIVRYDGELILRARG